MTEIIDGEDGSIIRIPLRFRKMMVGDWTRIVSVEDDGTHSFEVVDISRGVMK